MKTPEVVEKLKSLATEVLCTLGKPQLCGHIEIHFHDGEPKDVTTVDKVKLTKE